MFNIFNKKLQDAKSIRSELLLFIKEQLKKLEGGEGELIKGIALFVYCKPTDRFLFESAVYFTEKDRFKHDEVQKIADDFAVSLPDTWLLEINFVDNFPATAIQSSTLPVALQFIIPQQTLHKIPTDFSNGLIKTLRGQTEKTEFCFSKVNGRINIGRDKFVTLSNGFLRENEIVFLSDSKLQENKTVSRQHCHIEWNEKISAFELYADDGGIPPLNKTKIQSGAAPPVKIQTTDLGYKLNSGDHIILGETVVLEFKLTS